MVVICRLTKSMKESMESQVAPAARPLFFRRMDWMMSPGSCGLCTNGGEGRRMSVNICGSGSMYISCTTSWLEEPMTALFCCLSSRV